MIRIDRRHRRCHTHPIFSARRRYMSRSPKRHAAAAKKRSDDTNAGGRGGRKNTWTELHPLLCVRRPVAAAGWHGMACTCRKQKKASDDTWGSSFVQRGESSSCSHTSRATTPHQFPAEGGMDMESGLPCVTALPPPPRDIPSPTHHGHTEILNRPPQCSAPVDHPLPAARWRSFLRSFLTRVPGRAQWGWGGPNREGFETSISSLPNGARRAD